LHAVASLVPPAAASQYVGFTATSS